MSREGEERMLQTLREYLPAEKLLQFHRDLYHFVQRGTQHSVPVALQWWDDHEFESNISNLQSLVPIRAERARKVVVNVDVDPLERMASDPDRSRRVVQTLQEKDNEQLPIVLIIGLNDLLSNPSSSTNNMEMCSMWTAYIQSSKSVKSIDVHWDCQEGFWPEERVRKDMAIDLFMAMATNAGLEAVHLHGSLDGERKPPLDIFFSLLRTKPTLHELAFGSSWLDGEDHAAFVRALGANRSLTTVDVWLSAERDAALFPELRKIHGLKEVRLLDCGQSGTQNGLCSLVQSSESLEILHLEVTSLSEQFMNRLIDAMRSRQPPLTRLSFKDCVFEDDSGRFLVDYIEHSGIREFYLNMPAGSDTHRLSVESFAKLLDSRSRLCLLDFSGTLSWEDDCECTRWMIDNAADIRLDCLRLRIESVEPRLCVLVQGLRRVKRLEIVLSSTSLPPDFEYFKAMIKNTVHLTNISILKESDYDDNEQFFLPALTSDECNLLDAYCQHNELLPPLLSPKNPTMTQLLPFPALVTGARTLPLKDLQTAFLVGMMAMEGSDAHQDSIATLGSGDRKRKAAPEPTNGES